VRSAAVGPQLDQPARPDVAFFGLRRRWPDGLHDVGSGLKRRRGESRDHRVTTRKRPGVLCYLLRQWRSGVSQLKVALTLRRSARRAANTRPALAVPPCGPTFRRRARSRRIAGLGQEAVGVGEEGLIFQHDDSLHGADDLSPRSSSPGARRNLAGTPSSFFVGGGSRIRTSRRNSMGGGTSSSTPASADCRAVTMTLRIRARYRAPGLSRRR
jgi:hypothetical protein